MILPSSYDHWIKEEKAWDWFVVEWVWVQAQNRWQLHCCQIQGRPWEIAKMKKFPSFLVGRVLSDAHGNLPHVEREMDWNSWKGFNVRSLERKMTEGSETRNLGYRHVNSHMRVRMKYEALYLHVNVYQNVSIRQTLNIQVELILAYLHWLSQIRQDTWIKWPQWHIWSVYVNSIALTPIYWDENG